MRCLRHLYQEWQSTVIRVLAFFTRIIARANLFLKRQLLMSSLMRSTARSLWWSSTCDQQQEDNINRVRKSQDGGKEERTQGQVGEEIRAQISLSVKYTSELQSVALLVYHLRVCSTKQVEAVAKHHCASCSLQHQGGFMPAAVHTQDFAQSLRRYCCRSALKKGG